MFVWSRLRAAFAASTLNTYGFGSSASVQPPGPAASAIGTVVSPLWAPMSITKSPGEMNWRRPSTPACVICFGRSFGCSHWAYSTSPSRGN